MWDTTGWCLATWLKITGILAGLVVVVGLVWGWQSTAFALAVITAIVIDLLVIRGLAREWSWEARGSWWWFR